MLPPPDSSTTDDPVCLRLTELFHGAPISRALGMKLHYDSQKRAVFDFPRNLSLDHALQDVHGGMIATLLDNAGWFPVAAHYNCWVVTVEFQTRLLEPANQENLRSIGQILRVGKSLATAEMSVFGKSDRLVATGSGTFTVTKYSLETSLHAN